jgi:hypothetical protein
MFSPKRRNLAYAIVLIAAAGLCVRALASAVTTNYSVIIARPIVATSTTILFSMTLAQNVAPSSTLVFHFDPGYTVPASVTSGDGSLTIDGVARTLGPYAAPGVYGYRMNGSTLVLSTATDETMHSASTVRLLVGAEGGFANPSTTGTKQFSTDVYSPANALVGTAAGASFLANPIGVTASSTATNPTVQVVNVLPELRIGASDTNDDVTYYLTARSGGSVLFTQSNLLSTDNAGYATDVVALTGLSDGSYDIGIKTQQHLTRILRGVSVTSATTTALNFTDPANGSATGSQVLLAGDIDNTATSPATLGDDVVNSVDLSLLINKLDVDDPSGNTLRANLNQDVVVNSVDLSIMLKNLDVEGDR